MRGHRHARGRKVVFYDQRGNGRSGELKDGQSCTLADQIADLEALRAHLALDKIDLLGHSWGGYLQRFDLNPELPKFRSTTLVGTGRYDFNVAPSVAWAIHRAIPGSELVVFEKSGHLPFCEEREAFVSRVEAFLSH